MTTHYWFLIYFLMSLVPWTIFVLWGYEELIVPNCKYAILRVPYTLMAICLLLLYGPSFYSASYSSSGTSSDLKRNMENSSSRQCSSGRPRM